MNRERCIVKFIMESRHRKRYAIEIPYPIPFVVCILLSCISGFVMLFLCMTYSPQDARVVLLAGGDCLLDRDNGKGRLAIEGDGRWNVLRTACQPDAIFLCNLETTVGTGGIPRSKRYVFRAPPSALDPILAFPHPVVALANNHSLDYGPEGLIETIRELDRAGIAYAGAGLTKDEAANGTRLETRIASVAVLSFGYGGDPEPNLDGISASISPLNRSESLAAVSKAARDSILTVVMLHWGVEYETRYNQSQVSYAHALVKAGADVILGSGPHVTQGVELYRGALICYSLGNLVFDDLGNPEVSAALLVRVRLLERGDGKEMIYEIAPLRTKNPYHGPSRPTNSDAERIITNIIERSPDPTILSTKQVVNDKGLLWFRVGG